MNLRQSNGFSLVELLVVLAILGLLAGLAMPLAEMTVQRENERELKRALWEIRDALDAYKRAADAGRISQPMGATGYPPDLQTLVMGVQDVKSGEKLVFLRRIPRDPFAVPDLPAQSTWQLRSYESGPERPRPGGDVYDVSSSSSRLGLNGVPLKDW